MKAAAAWMNRMAEQHRGFALAVLTVAGFAAAHTLNILLNTEIPQVDETMAWAASAGLIIGAFVAFFGGFVAWLYLSFGIFLVLRTHERELSAAAVTSRTGVAFMFPLAGFVASLAIGAVGAPGIAATVIYAASAVYGLAVLAKALMEAEFARPVVAIAAVATPVIVVVAIIVLLTLAA
ncbi:MAG: hypothetical protein OXU63_03870 [Acidobacteriota bacterium]|nr:hypothetical protein [Acidobacteriota bacterium]